MKIMITKFNKYSPCNSHSTKYFTGGLMYANDHPTIISF